MIYVSRGKKDKFLHRFDIMINCIKHMYEFNNTLNINIEGRKRPFQINYVIDRCRVVCFL
jgi:hypothetical protein